MTDLQVEPTAVAFDRRSVWLLGGLFIAWILAVFFLTGGGSGLGRWIIDWKQWDAAWYERIFTDGYRTEPKMLVFPPLFSWLIGPAARALGSFTVAGLVVNLLAFFAAGLVMTKLALERYGVSPLKFFVFFLSAPTAYFAFATYSDSIFFLTFALSLSLAVRDPRTLSRAEAGQAWALLFLIPWLRLTGYALFAWTFLKRWYAVGTIIALVGWLSLNLMITGDPFYFLKSQVDFAMPQGNFIDGLLYTVRNIVPGQDEFGQVNWLYWLQFHFLPLFYLAAIGISAVWFAVKRDWLFAVTILSVALISHNQSFWRSALRYDLPLFCFMGIPLLSRECGRGRGRDARELIRTWARQLANVAYVVLVALGFVLQIYFARVFRSGQWGF